MINGSEIVKVLDLKTNQSMDISLYDLYLKARFDTDRFMVKDRYGWTHISYICECPNDGNVYIIQPITSNIPNIKVTSDHLIPVYDGTFTSGFHGVACYHNKCCKARKLSMLKTEPDYEHSGPQLLLNAESNKFYEFCITEKSDDKFISISIQTKSNYIDINGFSLSTNDDGHANIRLSSI